jgi:hypothetical protein
VEDRFTVIPSEKPPRTVNTQNQQLSGATIKRLLERYSAGAKEGATEIGKGAKACPVVRTGALESLGA